MVDEKLESILFVDDEPQVLEALSRSLFGRFNVATANGGKAGLELIAKSAPFAVVVSDMRMPEMNGAVFLAAVHQASPDSTRILLTGFSEIDAAIAAVNQGKIFRFLSKPCPSAVLRDALTDGCIQYRLVTAEADLLEKTLKGAISVMSDLLSLASPTAFSRANILRGYVTHLAKEHGEPGDWQVEIAAMLSAIGCVAMPPETLSKIYAGQDVPTRERDLFERHPESGFRLLSAIPRLEGVATIVGHQLRGDLEVIPAKLRLSVRMLRVALAVDECVRQGMTVIAAVKKLRENPGADTALLDTLSGYRSTELSEVVRALHIRELRSGMVLDEDIVSSSGNVIIGVGRELNAALIERLHNFAEGVGVVEPMRVRVMA